MAHISPLYLGFDLSTQQLKGIAVSSDLKVVHQAKFDFDEDSRGYGTTKGVLTNEEEHEVYAPVAAFLQALDGVLQRLQENGLEFNRVKGISGAGMQHGSVYWSHAGNEVLRQLDPSKSLESQFGQAFSYSYSPNWQDASTQEECDDFDLCLGDEKKLATVTGSKAHHRFTGPQILRFRRKHPEQYGATSRISLVSSFLASLFLGKIAPFDISDVCGMNLWDIQAGAWNENLLLLAAGFSNTSKLKTQLGDVSQDGGGSLGNISDYFVTRYNFDPSCTITPFTGDNPATILALPLRPLDAIVSLGTSTTFLMSTPHYKPNPSVHFMNHPTAPGLYMFMLCYKNGGLAREKVRSSLAAQPAQLTRPWERFDKIASEAAPLGQETPESPMKIGLYFPRPEIVPNVREGTWRFTYNSKTNALSASTSQWSLPSDDARAIVESQMLSLRLRSQDLVEPPEGKAIPAQPRRIYLVGGGSKNAAIARIAGQVLGGVEGVYRLDVGENACALGAAYKAVWAVERQEGETFEELIGARWKEEEFVKRIADGYQEGVFERYAGAVRTGIHLGVLTFIVFVVIFFLDSRFRVLPDAIHNALPVHQHGLVITDITLATCSSLNILSSCKLDASKWHRIEKDLYLSKGWVSHAYVHIERKREEELTEADKVIVDVRVGRLDPVTSEKDQGHERWESRPGGIWLKRTAKRHASDSVKAITAVDVLFGADAVEARPGWKLSIQPLQLSNNGDRPEAHLTVRHGTAPKKETPTLRVRKDGKFKILQVADMHLSTGLGICRDAEPPNHNGGKCDADPRTLEFVGLVLDSEKPDLVVLSGDQVNGETAPDAQSAVFKYAELFISRSIPFATIFGNHDDEGSLSREALMQLTESLPFSLGNIGPSAVDGVGNYYLEVLAHKSSAHSALTLYFLDTHAYSPDEGHFRGYDWLKKSQVDWFRVTSRELKSSPSHTGYSHHHMDMAFIHIPLPEYRNTADIVEGSGKAPEPPTAPGFNSGFKQALVDEGVLAVSCGHDHVNDYCALSTREGEGDGKPELWMCYAGGSGFGGYAGYGGFHRRVRVYDFDMNEARIETWKRVEWGEKKGDTEKRVDQMIIVEGGKVVAA